MDTTTQPYHIIKGDHMKSWEAVEAVQHEPFLYISGNGSHWYGEEESDLQALYDRLDETELDPRFEEYGGFITVNPCQGIHNPHYSGWDSTPENPQWIDGPRLFPGEVTYFNGNFFQWSHGFAIYTNVPEIIATLTEKIRANQATEAYQRAKRQTKES